VNLLDALMWLWCLIGTHASELSFFVTLFATFYIPKKIMNNQIYADLISEYRSAAIGQAVLSVTYFYTHDCNSDITKIEEKYTERYKKEVDSLLDNQKKEENRCENKIENSLHFQRRLLSQYYYQLASLRYQGCWLTRLAKRKVRKDFTAREAKLLSLLSYMNKVAEKTFIEYDIGDIHYITENKQNVLLEKLYDEAQQW